MSINLTVSIKCTTKEQIDAIKNCTIKIKNGKAVHTFFEVMNVSDLTVSFENCFSQENIKKGILVDLCKYIAECYPLEKFSLESEFISEDDSYEILTKVEYDGNKLYISTSTGYLGESDLDLECECAYLGEIKFDFENLIPDFYDLDDDEIKDLKCVICDDVNAFSNEITGLENRNIEILNEHDFIKRHIPYNVFTDLHTYADMEYADERVSMKTNESVYKMDDKGKWQKIKMDMKTHRRRNKPCNKTQTLYRYNNKTYDNVLTLISDLEADELVTEILDYGRSDYLACYYALVSDCEIGDVYYQIEDPGEFINKFSNQLGVEIQ